MADYLTKRREIAYDVRRENEARFDPAGVRERLLARRRTNGEPRDMIRFLADENFNRCDWRKESLIAARYSRVRTSQSSGKALVRRASSR